MIYDLVHSLKTGEEPAMSVSNAIEAFKTGQALFQSHRERNRLIRPEELDGTLRIVSI